MTVGHMLGVAPTELTNAKLFLPGGAIRALRLHVALEDESAVTAELTDTVMLDVEGSRVHLDGRGLWPSVPRPNDR